MASPFDFYKKQSPEPVQQQPLGGSLNDQIKEGFQRQLQQGFQNAMKIKATPQPAQNKAIAERRQAVAAQAMGIANTSTSANKPIDKNVGRRQPR